MTGREAIHLVRTSPLELVKQWHTAPTSCATLKRVCEWRLEDGYGWMALLREVKLLPVAERGTARAETLWRSGFYTDEEIAVRCGMTITTAKALRRTTFREAHWASQAAGKNVKAYRLP